MKLYCHSTPSDGNPHAVIIDLSDESRAAYQQQRQHESNLGKWDKGAWVAVETVDGEAWRVRSHPCGQPCRCAAQAERVSA